MPFRVSDALSGVRLAMADAAQKAARRSLHVYGQESRCSRGCAGCCSRMVTVTVAEAAVMLEHLIRDGSWEAVRERARAQAPTARVANERSWFLMNIPCPVLGPDRSCLAYESRPTPCSVHFSLSDPKLCDPWSGEPGEFRPVEMADVHGEFLKKLEREVDGYGVLALRLPLPAALLLAERVRSNARLTAEEVTSFIRTELA